MRAVGAALQSCRGRFGWGDARQNAALAYFRGGLIREQAASRLVDYGVTVDQFEAALEALSDADRQRLIDEAVTSGSAMTAAARALESQGAAFGAPQGEELQRIGQAIGQGLIGELATNQAEQAYRGH